MVEFKNALRAKALRLLPALPSNQEIDFFEMALDVEIKINGNKGKKITFEPKNWEKGIIFPFHKSQKIRKIVVKVISVQAGRRSGVGGFREIELLNK